LILAGISIAMLTGKNGLLQKTMVAKEVSTESKEKEQIQIEVLGCYKEDMRLSIEIVKEKLGNNIKGLIIDDATQFPLKVTYTDTKNTYLIDENGKIVICKGILAKNVKDEPQNFYGKKVNYRANDVTGWQIFFADESNIFLIKEGFLPNTKVPFDRTELKANRETSVYWSNMPTFQNNWNQYRENIMTGGYDLEEDYNSSKKASVLLNVNNWSNLVNSLYADFAIGGPTLEMWVSSWNSLYPNDLVYCNNTGTYGYYVGKDSSTKANEISKSVMNITEGYNNNLYYPFRDASCSQADGVAYLLSSPSANTSNCLMSIWSDGALGFCNTWDNKISGYNPSLRPIIRLRSEMGLKASNNPDYDYDL